jgi:menaquinone-9 beta-reductase
LEREQEGDRNVRDSLDANVVVVGAGPAGAATAARLGQLGIDGVVLVERHDSPREKTCGSGISPNGIKTLRELGVWDEIAREAYPITGLRLVTPGGREAYLSGGASVDAVVCRRSTLDHLVLQQAVSRGTRFVPRFDVRSLIEEGGRVAGVTARDGRTLRARYTVVAGGTHCVLAPARRGRRLIQAIMGWWEGVPFRPNHLEMVFDPMLRPLYGWLFPESDHLVNIGITYEDSEGRDRNNARALFRRFLDKHYAERLDGARPVGDWKGHPVAYSYRVERLTSPGRLIVGESGLLTHPATAEGIAQALRSGVMAAESLRDILVAGRDEAIAFAAYEKRCRDAFRGSFLRGLLFRGFVRTPALDGMLRLGQSPFVRRAAARILASL